MRNIDETGGWIFSDAAHTWMNVRIRLSWNNAQGFYRIKDDSKKIRPSWDISPLVWDAPARWPTPFRSQALRVIPEVDHEH